MTKNRINNFLVVSSFKLGYEFCNVYFILFFIFEDEDKELNLIFIDFF